MVQRHTSNWQTVSAGDTTSYTVPETQSPLSTEVRWRGASETRQVSDRKENQTSGVFDVYDEIDPVSRTEFIPELPAGATFVDAGWDLDVVARDFQGDDTGHIRVFVGGIKYADVHASDYPPKQFGTFAAERGGEACKVVFEAVGYRFTAEYDSLTFLDYIEQRTFQTENPMVELDTDSASGPATLADGEVSDWQNIETLDVGQNVFSHSIGGSNDAGFQFRYTYSGGAVPAGIVLDTATATSTASDREDTVEPADTSFGTTTASADIGGATGGWVAELATDGGATTDFGSETLTSVDIDMEHTAAWGGVVDMPPLIDIDAYRGGSMALFYRGVLRLRCPNLTERKQAGDGTITIGGIGPASELKEQPVGREFDNTTTHEAIRTLLREDASIGVSGVTVHEPPPQPVTNELVQSADTQAEFEDVLMQRSRTATGQFAEETGGAPPWQPSEPFAFVGDGAAAGVQTTQTCHVIEAEDATSAQPITANDASGGKAAALLDTGDSLSATRSFNHEIPEGKFSIAIRGRRVDAGVSNVTTTAQVKAADTELFSFTPGSFTVGGGFEWAFFSTDYTPGTGDIPLSVTVTQSGGAQLDIDCVALYDDRYLYNFDTQTDMNGALAGPELYPDAAALSFRSVPAGIALDSTTVTAAVAEPAEGDTVGVEYTRGASSSESLDGTRDSHTAAFDATTTQVRPTVELSRTSDGRITTPTEGNQPQKLESVRTAISGNAIPVIDHREFDNSNVFDAVQSLCSDFGFVFTVEHGRPPGVFDIEVFKKGDPALRRALPASAVITSESESAEATNYANIVTVVGAEIPDSGGERYSWTEKAEEEIEAFGREPAPKIENEELRGVNDCRSVARAELAARLDEDERGGSLDVTPSLPPPGYPYHIPIWDEYPDVPGWGEGPWGQFPWGSPQAIATLESASLSESAGDSSTSLAFSVRSNLLAALTGGL